MEWIAYGKQMIYCFKMFCFIFQCLHLPCLDEIVPGMICTSCFLMVYFPTLSFDIINIKSSHKMFKWKHHVNYRYLISFACHINNPPHINCISSSSSCKWWLQPVTLHFIRIIDNLSQHDIIFDSLINGCMMGNEWVLFVNSQGSVRFDEILGSEHQQLISYSYTSWLHVTFLQLMLCDNLFILNLKSYHLTLQWKLNRWSHVNHWN